MRPTILIVLTLLAMAVVAIAPISAPAETTSPDIGCVESVVADCGMVATVHPEATDAAVAAVRRGGNAVDAAVAAALTLGVVDNHLSGIGGGCFILIRLPDGRFVAIDGRETAPAKATSDMYVRDGKPQPELSQLGPLAVATPGALAAYEYVIAHYGQLALSDLLLPAAELAERGVRIRPSYAKHLKRAAPELTHFKGSREVLLKPDGKPYQAGDVLKQPDLARTYRRIAEEGTDYFYRGPIAKRIGQWMAKHGGILTADDFANYRIRLREPLVTTYRQYTVVGFPPPSSGGVHVAQMLNILEQYDLASLRRRDRTQYIHTVAEAMKLAFADRAWWLGDPDFAQVPRGLIDKQYAKNLAKRIDPKRATKVSGRGTPPRYKTDFFPRSKQAVPRRKSTPQPAKDKAAARRQRIRTFFVQQPVAVLVYKNQPLIQHTTHIAVADAEGNWVALTATLNLAFGSKVIVPDTGVVLNSEMGDFAVAPGVPNAFGLVGNKANEVEPGKRPLSSMSPTIVLENDKPVLAVGAAGGPKIITQTLLTILNRLDHGMPLNEAIATSRFHHQWRPNTLSVEENFPKALEKQLRQRGHEISRLDYVGVTQAVGITPEGCFVGQFDPRVQGKASGFGPVNCPDAAPQGEPSSCSN